MAIKIHHLNCGSLCPVGGFLYDGFSPRLGGATLSCHCLLIETERNGLVLVDTGFGLFDIQCPRPRLSRFFLDLCRPTVRSDQTAHAQIQQLGFSPEDVRHIVLTHMDFDHAGGIDDFPEATVHPLADEKEAALRRVSSRGLTVSTREMIARGRYRPLQYRHHSLWRTYEPSGDRWFSFDAVRQLDGLPPEILLVPLIGHTLGHCGVAVRSDQGWLFHTGDAYFFRGEMDSEHPHCTPGLKFYQWVMDTDRRWRFYNQERLRELVRDHSPEVRVFCAHDQQEFEALSQIGAFMQSSAVA